MIELMILYILNRYDATIYKIAKIMDEFFFAYSKASLGSINPALNRLENHQYVAYEEKMSEGGKKSKLYHITPQGLKFLKHQLVKYKFKNYANILNSINILFFCSDVLDVHEKVEFQQNITNCLILYKSQIERKIEDPYSSFTTLQKRLLQEALKPVENLIKTVQGL